MPKCRLVWLLVLIGFCFIGCARDKWSERDWGREIAWQTIHAIDWRQTRYIAKHPDDYRELNPILGEHPSTERVDLYFLAGALVHPLITDLFPGKYRPFWQWISLGISGGCVANNFRIGIKIDW